MVWAVGWTTSVTDLRRLASPRVRLHTLGECVTSGGRGGRHGGHEAVAAFSRPLLHVGSSTECFFFFLPCWHSPSACLNALVSAQIMPHCGVTPLKSGGVARPCTLTRELGGALYLVGTDSVDALILCVLPQGNPADGPLRGRAFGFGGLAKGLNLGGGWRDGSCDCGALKVAAL
ncbi:hypothetical protein TraAM80_00760 [Trypanosoma rangeli]|uniref:Uncharacterized protein n=1 Tax=Trypanosoma rangeli TaxID=5698 RepID=A0A3R7P2E2_TRYRA|nr:uncharacterized protein TraAM80_00760 [Trypanosoma rangeli]RNF11677.1 hypothetical protein TraAM80_00760 [Trypanosoma rangeli]|eukprot:RNF11677.1 hypothetical protein TraAM80_00760 [Trypanosoma rangeli]